MKPITDPVFGDLVFEASWVRYDQIKIFGKTYPVRLRVEGNDAEESILDEQRASYTNFRANEERLVGEAVEALFQSYLEIRPSLVSQFGPRAGELAPPLASSFELSKLVEFTTLMFPIVLEEGEQSFGLMGSCTWDPEHGIGIKVTDGDIEIGGDDLLT
jgi:hypothetical protein